MDTKLTGALIARLRKENGQTQAELAQTLHVSVQAVSKWERGLGCPDVSLLPLLAEEFGVPMERLLAGDLCASDKETGNMKRLKFYVCPTCGNLLTAAGPAQVHCCGRKLAPLVPGRADALHAVRVENVEDEWYLAFDHPMEKEHFIRFFAYVSYDRCMIARLYPEQSGELRIPRMHGGELYACCSKDGLFEITV